MTCLHRILRAGVLALLFAFLLMLPAKPGVAQEPAGGAKAQGNPCWGYGAGGWNDTRLDIPDHGGWVWSRIDVPDAAPNADASFVVVTVKLNHPFCSDVELGLIHDGVEVSLSPGPQNCEYGGANEWYIYSAFGGTALANGWWLGARDTAWYDQGYIEYWQVWTCAYSEDNGGSGFVAQGHVYDAASHPMPGVTLYLESLGGSGGDTWTNFVRTVQTDANGAFMLPTDGGRATYQVRVIDPNGYAAYIAQAGPGGRAVGSDIIRFEGSPTGVHAGNEFYLREAPPPPGPRAPLILSKGVNGYTGTKDTFIDGWETNRHDCNSSIYVRNDSTWGALLRFDLTQSIPTGAYVGSAYLRLYTEMRTNDGLLDLGVWRLKRDWSECDATWIKATASENWGTAGCKNTTTDRDAEPAGVGAVPARTGRATIVDVTSLVQGWVNDPATNKGMYLSGIGDVATGAGFASSNNANVDRRPALIINWATEPPPTPTITKTPKPTATPSITPTASRTATPTATPIATPTATHTATPTVTRTATPTAAPSPTPTMQPGGARLAVSPASKSVALAGGNTTIDIVAKQASDWGGYEFDLTFDPDVVHVVSVTRGPFLCSSGRTLFATYETWDNAAGRLKVMAVTTGAQAGASGDGVVASVTFQPVAPGSSDLHLENVLVAMPEGESLAVGLDHGQINVTRCLGDFDGDGDVDVLDLQMAASHWGCHTGQGCYEARFDADGDGDVDILDLQRFAAAWGTHCNTAPAPAAKPAASMALGANLGLLPPPARVAVGDTFTVTLHIDGAGNVGAYQAELLFDPAIVSVQAVTPAGFLGSTGRSVSPAGPEIDNQAGWVTFGAFTFGAQAGASGEGDLAQVRFLARAPGQSALTLQDVQLSDPQGEPEAVGMLSGGSVTAGQTSFEFHLPIALRG